MVVFTLKINVHPFNTTVPFLYPPKSSENQKVSSDFRGYGNGALD